MLSFAIRLALAVDLLLMAIEHAVHYTRRFLPIGGEELMQLAVLLCIAIALHEIVVIVRRKKVSDGNAMT